MDLIQNLLHEIKENPTSNRIKLLEKQISQNFEQISSNNLFYKLPLSNIFSIISNVEINGIDDILLFYKNIVQNTIKEHSNEKECIFLLQLIQCSNDVFCLQDCMDLLKYFKDCSLLSTACMLYEENNLLPETDYNYIISEKDKIIEELNDNIKELNDNILKLKDKYMNQDITSAIADGDLENVKYLIEIKHHDINKGVFSEAPIITAIHYQEYDILSYLIENHADLEVTDSSESTPLRIAAGANDLQAVKLLCENNANVEARNYNGNTALDNACAHGCLDVVKYLIECANANINSQDNELDTPLHNASFYGNLEVVRYLVSKGADKTIKDQDDKTPFDVACGFGSSDLSNKSEIQRILSEIN